MQAKLETIRNRCAVLRARSQALQIRSLQLLECSLKLQDQTRNKQQASLLLRCWSELRQHKAKQKRLERLVQFKELLRKQKG